MPGMSGGITGGQTLLHGPVKALAGCAALIALSLCAAAAAQTVGDTSGPAEPLPVDAAFHPSTAIEDRTGDMQVEVLGALLAKASSIGAATSMGPGSLDSPAYDNLMSHPASYRLRAVRITMRVYQAIKVDPSAEGWPQASWSLSPVWRLEGFNAGSPEDAGASQPLIAYAALDPSAAIGQPGHVDPDGTGRYDPRPPTVELAGLFYKLYRTRDVTGELRDYPVLVAWQLAKVDTDGKTHPFAAPLNILLVIVALALVFLLLRVHLRRSATSRTWPAEYHPRRYVTAEGEGAPDADSGEVSDVVPLPVRQDGENRIVTVALGERSYDVFVGPAALARLGATVAALGNVRQAVIIADSKVAELYGRKALDSLAAAGLTAAIIDFPAGEEHKTLATYGAVTDELLAVEPAIDRDTVVVALGGGVAGDLAGFVAATVLRGLRWVGCPTTLLADVDASVGGKTAVDHPSGKNLIGAFHQPRAVVIDVSTLKTLDARQLRTGLAECVKHGIISNESLLDFIATSAKAILAADVGVMTELVARNVAIKAGVVSADERESSLRSYLNFGHTVGHAIEVHLGVGKVTHGEAVSLGMVAACEFAVRRGLIDAAYAKRLRDLLAALGLPVVMKDLDVAAIWRIMQHDKKARAGKVRMVLPTGPGQVDIFDDIREAEIANAVAAVQGQST